MPRKKQKVVADDEKVNTIKLRINGPTRKSKRLADVVESTSSAKADEQSNTNGSSSESDWEEVEESNVDDDGDREPVIPKDGVEFTLESLPNDGNSKRKRKRFDLDEYFRKQLRKFKKDMQESMHKVHLLCLLARGFHVNSAINEDVVRAVALSLMPPDLGLPKRPKTLKDLQRVQTWFRSTGFLATTVKIRDAAEQPAFTVESLLENLGETSSGDTNWSPFRTVVVVAVFLRTFGFQVRIVFSLHPTPLKLPAVQTKTKSKPPVIFKKDSEKNENKDVKKINNQTMPADDGPSTKLNATSCTTRRSSLRSQNKKPVNLKKESEAEEDEQPKVTKKPKGKVAALAKTDEDEVDKDFEVEFVKISNPGPLTGVKKNRKTVSSDSDEDVKASRAALSNDCWLEVYVEEMNQWTCVDPIHDQHFDKPHEIEKNTTQPMKYVVAFDDAGHLKDVTKRYATGWLINTRKLRVDFDWWEETLVPFRGPSSKKDRDEDSQLDKNLKERPLPTSISEFKGHPLYALKRHLLKFEGIYPSDAVPVGFIRGEPVYPRHCIRELHSRETWLKEARLVRIGETPYKVVKARPKWNKAMGELQSDLPLDLFGEWQTEDYIPPAAKDGKVPRNDYGNVELFKPSMLPSGTVHLQIPGLNRVARKLNIDCAQAMIGWDFHGVGSHPTFDGWIVCEEFKDVLLDAWNEEQIIINQKEQEKREKRIYGNWRRVIRGLLIRERLQVKYGSQPTSEEVPAESDSKEKSSKKQRKK